MKKILFALGLSLTASASFAYNGQIDGGFTYFDHDDSITDSNGAFDLSGTLYFNPVNAKYGPLNEAAFLGHNSNASLAYSYNYWESKNIAGFEQDNKINNISASIEYFYEQFYVEGALGFSRENEQSKLNGFKVADEDYDTTLYRALAGFMPMPNLLLAAGIDGYQGDGDNDDNRFAVKAKYVAALDHGQALNLEADGAFGDTDTVMLGADYYFNPAFSLGAEYSMQDDGDDDTDFFAVRSKYFIHPDFAVGGAIGFGDDVIAFNINASFRF
ncbi:putative porin [Acinetobacter sp.]|uniref:putative porin n=1 Tax=Acinetobacter sp. TaxID=472 RepID=UPI0035B38DF0